MLLYIHVPFCRSKCAYCSFYSQPFPEGRSESVISAYTTSLFDEIRLWGQKLSHPTVTSVFFGGGTPSLLPAKLMPELMAEIRKEFDIAPDAEISAEANPESALANGWMEHARKAGVNRLSIGVQTFNPEMLKILGRAHTADEARKAVEEAHSFDFQSINLDLIWGLPGQSLQDWLSDLDEAIRLGTHHVSAYGLTLEPGSPLANTILDGELALPDDEVQAEMFLQTAERLKPADINQYEISNYARPGHECRHNLGYWQGEDYLGLGPAATSTLGSSRLTNPSEMRTWQLVTQNKLYAEEEKLTPEIKVREFLMLSLRTTKGLSFAEWEKRTGWPLSTKTHQLALALRAAKLLEITPERMFLTPRGMLLSNLVIEQLFNTL